MDTTKKYMYFQTNAGDSDTGVSVPVSTFVGMETTASNRMKLYFKEAIGSNVLEISVDRTSGGNPRNMMQAIVHDINFSKDATVVVADDFKGQYAHFDIISVITLSDAAVPNASGTGMSGVQNSLARIHGEMVSSFLIDLETASAHSGGSAGKVIGRDSSGSGGAAYVTQITEFRNGIITHGELLCLEAPVGGEDNIGVAFSSTSLEEGGTPNHLDGTAADQYVGKRTAITIGQDVTSDYVYLYTGGTDSGNYSAGRFILRLFGVPQDVKSRGKF